MLKLPDARKMDGKSCGFQLENPPMRKPTIPELLSGVAAVALWIAVILLSVEAV